MEDVDINWLSILAAAVSSLVIEFLWYAPLFGKFWMKESGMTEENKGRKYGAYLRIEFHFWMLSCLLHVGPSDGRWWWRNSRTSTLSHL